MARCIASNGEEVGACQCRVHRIIIIIDFWLDQNNSNFNTIISYWPLAIVRIKI